MPEFEKRLGYLTIISLSISSILGTAIFFGPAIGAHYSGKASIIAWIILGVFTTYISACFGELVSMFPKAGGIYEFTKQTYGRFISFIAGWTAWVVGNITTAVLVVAATDFLVSDPRLKATKLILSLSFILLLNIVAYLGVEMSAAIVVVFAFITLFVISSIIIRGLFLIDISNLLPIIPSGGLIPILPQIFITIFFIAETFFGWEGAAYLSEETKNPERVIPKAIVTANIIIAIMAVLLTIVFLSLVPLQGAASADAPLAGLAGILFGSQGIRLVAIGIFLTFMGSAAGGVITMPRLVLALARDRLFLGQFKAIHPRFKTPYKAIIFQTIISMIIVAICFGQYRLVLSLLVPLALVMYTLAIMSVPILRIKRPELNRPFKAPFGETGPVISALFFLALIALWVWGEPNAFNILKLSLSFIMMGFPLYFLVELYYDPKAITEVSDVFAYFTLITEPLSLPQRVREEIFVLLGDIRGKTVLEVGCSVGTLTLQLAHEVGPHGIIYATDFSKNEMRITRKRLALQEWASETRGHGIVRLLHDEDQTRRIHPSITYADAIVSVGLLSYIQDVKKVLMEAAAIMPAGGKLCFVEYGDFFHIIPNVEWLANNSTVESIFRECGFSVQVIRKKGFFWNYIFIYGMKYTRDVPFI